MSKKSKDILLIDLIKLLYKNIHFIILSVIIFVVLGIIINISSQKNTLKGYAHIPINPFFETKKDKTVFIIDKLLEHKGLPFLAKLDVEYFDAQTYLSQSKDNVKIFESAIITKKTNKFIDIKFESNESKEKIFEYFKKLSNNINIYLAEIFNEKIKSNIGVVVDIYNFRNDFHYKLLSTYYFRLHGAKHRDSGEGDADVLDEKTYRNMLMLEPRGLYMQNLERFSILDRRERKVYLDLLYKITNKKAITESMLNQLLISESELEYSLSDEIFIRYLTKKNTTKSIFAYAILGIIFGTIAVIIRKKI